MSRAALRLESRHKIRRTRILEDGRWTYELAPLKSVAHLLEFKMEDGPDGEEEPSSIERQRAWTWQQSALARGRISIDKALNDLDLILEKLSLGADAGPVAREAHNLLRQMIEAGFNTGRNSHGLMALSIYVACRRLNVAVTLKDVCNFSLSQRKVVAAYYREMYNRDIAEVPLANPALQLDRILENLRKITRWAVYATDEAKTKALAILDQARAVGVLEGKNPAGLAGTAVYVACSKLIPQAEVAKAASVTEVTLRNNYKKLVAAGLRR